MKKYFFIIPVLFIVSIATSCDDYMGDMEIQTGLNEGLVAYYPVKEPVDNAVTSTKDYSGKGNNLNGIGYEVQQGKFNNAISFINELTAAIQKENLMEGSNSFTITMWVKYQGDASEDLSPTPTDITLLAHESDWADILAHGTKVTFRTFDGSFISVTSDTNVLNNTWAYVSGVFGGNTMYLYINGILAGKAASACDVSGLEHFSFNSEENITNDYLSVDEFRLYNRALSQDEIKALMDVGMD